MFYSGLICVLCFVCACLISHFLPALRCHTFLPDLISPILRSNCSLIGWNGSLKRVLSFKKVFAALHHGAYDQFQSQFSWKLCCTVKKGWEWFIVINALCQCVAPAQSDQLTPSPSLEEVMNSADSVQQHAGEHGCTWCQEGFILRTYTRLMETVTGCKEEKKQLSPWGGASQVFPWAQTLIWRHQRAAFFSLSQTICLLPAANLSLAREPSFTWAGRLSSVLLSLLTTSRFHICIDVDSWTDLFHISGWCGTAAVFRKEWQQGDFSVTLNTAPLCVVYCLSSSQVLQWRDFISTGVFPMMPSVPFDMLVK